MRISVGTCGFSYRDWVGPIYPPRTQAGAMLGLYARRFPVVEIDSTYYAVPAVEVVDGWARKTPPGFRFTVKLPASATHVPRDALGTISDDVRAFRAVLRPLLEAGKFACALMQFPNAFRPGAGAERHLHALREALPGLPLVAEFRHREWQTDETLGLLRELGVGLAAVDEPQFATLMRPMTDATSPIAYVRFHGRNAAQWWKGDNVTRYDYSYSREELERWADRIVDIAANADVREVLTFFNNHARGQAAHNAEHFEELVARRLPKAIVRAVPPDDPPAEEPRQRGLFGDES